MAWHSSVVCSGSGGRQFRSLGRTGPWQVGHTVLLALLVFGPRLAFTHSPYFTLHHFTRWKLHSRLAGPSSSTPTDPAANKPPLDLLLRRHSYQPFSLHPTVHAAQLIHRPTLHVQFRLISPTSWIDGAVQGCLRPAEILPGRLRAPAATEPQPGRDPRTAVLHGVLLLLHVNLIGIPKSLTLRMIRATLAMMKTTSLPPKTSVLHMPFYKGTASQPSPPLESDVAQQSIKASQSPRRPCLPPRARQSRLQNRDPSLSPVWAVPKRNHPRRSHRLSQASNLLLGLHPQSYRPG